MQNIIYLISLFSVLGIYSYLKQNTPLWLIWVFHGISPFFSYYYAIESFHFEKPIGFEGKISYFKQSGIYISLGSNLILYLIIQIMVWPSIKDKITKLLPNYNNGTTPQGNLNDPIVEIESNHMLSNNITI